VKIILWAGGNDGKWKIATSGDPKLVAAFFEPIYFFGYARRFILAFLKFIF